MVDDDVQLLLNVNVVVPIVQQYFQVAVFDHVRAVAFLTTYDLDFQPFEGNRYKPTIKRNSKYTQGDSKQLFLNITKKNSR